MKKLLFILALLGLTAFAAPVAQASDRDHRHHGDEHRSYDRRGRDHHGYRNHHHQGGRRYYYRHGHRYYYGDYGYPGYYGPAYDNGVSVHIGL